MVIIVCIMFLFLNLDDINVIIVPTVHDISIGIIGNSNSPIKDIK